MKRLLLNTLAILTLSAASVPVLAMEHPLSSTSNALPLLETVAVHGKITQIDGKRVQVQLPNGMVEAYYIPESRQQQYGLTVGSEVTLGVRRFNNAVITIDRS